MQVSSTSSQAPGTKPTLSRPMSVSGCRPVANSASSAVTSPPVFQGQGDRPGAARAAYPGDGDADPHVHPGPVQSPADQFTGEGLHPRQQAVVLGQQGDRGAQALPGAGHFYPDPPPTTMASRPGTA
jgi:hypothetical protein